MCGTCVLFWSIPETSRCQDYHGQLGYDTIQNYAGVMGRVLVGSISALVVEHALCALVFQVLPPAFFHFTASTEGGLLK